MISFPPTPPGTIGPFQLDGGRYAIAFASASWGGGNAVLQILMPDGATYVSISGEFLANGGTVADLPKGTYQIVLTTATVQGFIQLVPTWTALLRWIFGG